MNERIKELIAQATVEVRSHGAFGESERYSKLDPEKFAKLIALESAKVCEDYSAQVLRFSQFGSNAAADCAKMIKQHFGIDK